MTGQRSGRLVLLAVAAMMSGGGVSCDPGGKAVPGPDGSRRRT